MKKILYIYTGGRKARLKERKNNIDIPLEFFLGYPYLCDKGHDVEMLELTDLQPDTKSSAYKELEVSNSKLTRITSLTSSSHLFFGSIDILNKYDLIVASNEYIALGLSYYKEKKMLTPGFVFIVMGMLSKTAKLVKLNRGIDRVFNFNYRTAVKHYNDMISNSEQVVFLGEGEYNYALTLFGKYSSRFHYLPYSIDTDFWRPSREDSAKSYTLFVGNDVNRDFDLLKRISRELKDQKFVFISSRIDKSGLPGNVELIKGDWKQLLLDDAEVRKYYHNSRLVILPLKETLQPSGQSVCLQAMACGVPVLISKTEGFWDTSNFVNNRHLVFVEKNTVEAWCSSIRTTLDNHELMSILSKEGRLLVENKYNLTVFGDNLEGILSKC